MRVSDKRKRLARWTGLLLALAPFCGGAEPDSSGPIHAVELLLWTPDKIDEELRALTPTYAGESPEELLKLLDFMVLEEEKLTGQRAAGADSLGQGYGPAIDRALDLLGEWPSPRQIAAMKERLQEPSDKYLRSGLRAAAFSATDPAIAALIVDALDRAVKNGREDCVVLGLLALGESRNPALMSKLEAFLADPSPARHAAAARAIEALRTSLGQLSVPPLNDKAEVPTACVIGPDLLTDYRSLPRVAATNAGAATVLALTVDARMTALTDETIQVLERVLAAGGTALIANPDAADWPPSMKQWAEKNKVSLPGQPRDAFGGGLVRYADYRSFADYPYELRDQPGRAATRCWGECPAPLVTPILSGNLAGALVVLQENVLGKGRLVFTTVDLNSRPIYRENLLRWIYGEALLAHAYEFTKDYSFQATGHTEHTEWLKPISGAKPKILYLTSTLFKRGLLELLERLDMEWRYVPYDASFALPAVKNETGPPSRMAQRAVCLLEESIPWADVLVFDVGSQNLIKSLTQSVLGTMSLDSVPARLRRAIYRRVHVDGMGLLGISDPRAPETCIQEFVARAAGPSAETNACRAFTATLDPFQVSLGFRTAERGKGRLIWFNRPLPHLETGYALAPQAPAEFAVPGLYVPQFPVLPREYDYALLTKCALWTFGGDTRPSIVKAEAQGVAGQPASVKVTLSKPFKGRCEVAFRDAYNVRTVPTSTPVDGVEIAFKATALPEGLHIAEVRLADPEGKIVDVAAVRLAVAGPVRIESSTPDQRFYGTGETARLTVTLSAPFSGVVRLEAVDTYGRHVFTARKTQAAAQTFTVEIPIRDPLTRLWDAHVWLFDGDRVVSHQRQPIGIRLPPRERDFDVTASIADPTLVPFFRDVMGADVTYGNPELALRQKLDLSSGSWDDSLGASCTPGSRTNPRERDPCLSSPSFRMRAIRDVREKGDKFRDLGIRDYMIDDECGLGGRDFSPDSLSRFRVKMREVYGDIGTLNREWGSSFVGWDDVLPCQGGDFARPGAYVDFDIYISWVFAEYCNFLEMLAADTMGAFYAGQSGGVSDNLMMQQAGALYYYGVIERAVSMKRPDAVIGSWYEPGYRFVENHETASRRWPWWQLFRGTTRMQIWYPSSGPPAYQEDLSRPYKAFAWLKEEMDDARLGIAKLMLHAQRDEGRAAIYSSERSRFVLAALKEVGAASVGAAPAKAVGKDISEGAGNRFQQAILNEQVECRFMSEYQAEAGDIARRGLKLILLPGGISLSALERQALKSFVEAGGVLVVDIGAGTRNEHGTLAESGLVEEWLGVGNMPAASSAEALATKPFGKGQVVILDFAVLGEDMGPLARKLLLLAGLKPVVSVTATDSRRIALDFGNFSEGGALYAGFVIPGKGGMVSQEEARIVTVTFPEAAHIYDARKGGYLGQIATLKTNAIPSIAQVYAALPYRLDGLDVAASGTTHATGETVECVIRAKVTGPKPGLQVWLLQVRGPGGVVQNAYTRRVLARAGEATVSIPIALNAPPGAWEVVVRDAATGVTGQGTFQVKEETP